MGGYFFLVHHQQLTNGATDTAHAVRSLASVIAVVLVVLTLLIVTVYTVVFVDVMPQMR